MKLKVEGDPSIAVGDKVEISYRGLIDFDEEHPDEAVKIVVITDESKTPQQADGASD